MAEIYGIQVREEVLPHELWALCRDLDRKLQSLESHVYSEACIHGSINVLSIRTTPVNIKHVFQMRLFQTLLENFLAELKASFCGTPCLRRFTDLMKKYQKEEVSIRKLKREGEKIFKEHKALAILFTSVIQTGMLKSNKRPRDGGTRFTVEGLQPPFNRSNTWKRQKSLDREKTNKINHCCARVRSDAVLPRVLPPVIAAKEFGATDADLDKASQFLTKVKEALQQTPGRYREFLSVVLNAGTLHGLEKDKAKPFIKELLTKLMNICQGTEISKEELQQFLPKPDFLIKKQKVLCADSMMG